MMITLDEFSLGVGISIGIAAYHMILVMIEYYKLKRKVKK